MIVIIFQQVKFIPSSSRNKKKWATYKYRPSRIVVYKHNGPANTYIFYRDYIVLKILIKMIKQSCQFTMAIASEPVRRLTKEQVCQKSETLLRVK